MFFEHCEYFATAPRVLGLEIKMRKSLSVISVLMAFLVTAHSEAATNNYMQMYSHHGSDFSQNFSQKELRDYARRVCGTESFWATSSKGLWLKCNGRAADEQPDVVLDRDGTLYHWDRWWGGFKKIGHFESR